MDPKTGIYSVHICCIEIKYNLNRGEKILDELYYLFFLIWQFYKHFVMITIIFNSDHETLPPKSKFGK